MPGIQSDLSESGDERFRIVFWGQAARGCSREQLAAAFTRRFHIKDLRQLQILFSGAPVYLKRNLTTIQAHRYISAIQEMGGICRMECESSPTDSAKAPETNRRKWQRRAQVELLQGV